MNSDSPRQAFNNHVGSLLWLVRDYLTWQSVGRTLTRQYTRWRSLRTTDRDPLHIISDEVMERSRSIDSALYVESRDVFRRLCDVLKSERDSGVELDTEERELMDLWHHWSELKRRKAERGATITGQELENFCKEFVDAWLAAKAAYVRMAKQYGLEVDDTDPP